MAAGVSAAEQTNRPNLPALFSQSNSGLTVWPFGAVHEFRGYLQDQMGPYGVSADGAVFCSLCFFHGRLLIY